MLFQCHYNIQESKGELFNLEFQIAKKGLAAGTITAYTSEGILRISSTETIFNNIISGLEGVGWVANAINVGVNYAQYRHHEIGPNRLAYRLAGVGVSIISPYLYGSAMGVEGGPGGVVAGLALGALWSIGEKAHDVLTTDHPQTPAGYENIHF
jgi:hypothetical protein